MKMQKLVFNRKLKPPVKQRVMKKVVKRFLRYVHNPKYEFGFQVTAIHKKWSNLPAHIYIDDNGTWINLGNKKIILFEPNNSGNGYLEYVIPMTIEDDPQIVAKNNNIL
jgi:hypothetical protein